ncbi:MAG: SDR family oxidoreductase [Candidatus Omnitrophota bacterium]|nr:MAG: SDR family oxidoreductase [Candidatus Omnitrophota bacterium]
MIFEDIKEKKVLVTGAGTGIGACIAEVFASCGAFVGIHYRNSKKEATALKNHILKCGGRAELFKVNLLDSSSREKLIPAFVKAFGGLDILINNAGGIYGFKDFLKLDEKSWEDTFTLNAKSAFFLARDAFFYMKRHGGGKIINISSVSAKYGGSSQSIHYGAAKAALEAVTKGLARAGAKYNILANSIRGGFIDTPFHKKIARENITERINLIPLKRAGKPIDIAKTALFLGSSAGDYVTGETFTVAGGD